MSTPYDYITINTPSGGISTTYTGTEINFNTPAISDVTKAEVAFTAKQTLNGYSYPWPGGAGKNKIVQPYSDNYTNTVQGVTFTKNADGSIKAVGTVTTAGDYTFYTDAIAGNGGYKGSFILNGITGGSSATYRFGVRIRNTQTTTNRYVFVDSGDSEVITTGENEIINRLYIAFKVNANVNTTFYPMLRLSSVTDATYAPYENICPITGSSSVTLYKRASSGGTYQSSYYKYLNSTVYNGSFEYITGKVTKTYASITLNSSDLTWSVYNDSSTSRAFRASIIDMKSLSHSNYDSTQCFCTQASWTSSSSSLSFGKFYYSSGYVYFPDYVNKRFATVADFTAWLDAQETAGTPVTILYPLATPTETTLATTVIRTLAGQNYFDTSSTASSRLPLIMTVRQSSFSLPRPLNFGVQREDIYAGQYTTCTGATRADRIGWKYSDMTWTWDGMKQSDVEKLCGLTGECTLIFDDPSGDTIEESFIRSSVVSMRCRNKFMDEYWWTGVSCSIRFIDSHTN